MTWPMRSRTADPAALVQGWPRDYRAGYQHPTAQAQLDAAWGQAGPRLARWMRGETPEVPGWLFYGKPGHGKTSTALALVLAAAREGFTARFSTAERLAAERESTTFNAREGTTALGLLSDLLAPEVLLVDDIGTREYSPTVRALFLDMVRERHSYGRLTILTTNVPLNTAEGQAAFGRSTDARLLSTYTGHAFNAGTWTAAPVSLRTKP